MTHWREPETAREPDWGRVGFCLGLVIGFALGVLVASI
jgi:hypothetical protein